MSKEKHAAWLAERRAEIIAKLNKDFAKPWFGWKMDDSVVEDFADMTYEEVVLRMVRLMYVVHEERWVELSLRNLTGDWLRRIEERFAGIDRGTKALILQSYSSLDKPAEFVKKFFEAYPAASEQLLASEDKAYFLAISQRPGQKPVPFIPVLDANFEVWFKKDSLWAAEDIEAVFDQDPQRVCILQGPVVVEHATKKDEPIKEMLDNITALLIYKLAQRLYGGDLSRVPIVNYLSTRPSPLPEAVVALLAVERAIASNAITYSVGSALPEVSTWLEILAGPHQHWLRALLPSTTIVQGSLYVDNPILRLFSPRRGQKIVLTVDGVTPLSVALYGAACSHGQHKLSFKAVEVKYNQSSQSIDVTLFEDRRNVAVPLYFKFLYKPSTGYAPLHEVSDDRNKRMKDFYWRLWFGDNEVLPEINLRKTFTGPEVTIQANDVETFCSVVGNEGEAFKTARTDRVQAPMDFAIVTGWQAIMKAIFPAAINGDLLKLVHLSNGFRVLNAGDVCKSEARIVSVTNSDAGKIVKVKGFVTRDNVPVIEVVSSFLYCGRYSDFENTFKVVEEPDYLVEVDSEAQVGVLQSKEWFEWDGETKPLQAGTGLIFQIKSEATYRNKTCFKTVSVSGDIFVRDQLKRLVNVGSVDFLQDDSCGNPVLAYLQYHGAQQSSPSLLPSEGYTTSKSDSTVFRTPVLEDLRQPQPYSRESVLRGLRCSPRDNHQQDKFFQSLSKVPLVEPSFAMSSTARAS
ncbi:hypothetical protein FOMPIDRAFT_1051298 [Fomitopsis schrenkii]|uniref:Uncharacterized protein n=1 Tax=Fomitopsis schrenkii TaxID=2126942 RepID=S8E1J3_FOMSC|nr:hypothetical protein FOMPIDRAFT_1051298 [Fomitopsis schrenkii]